MGVQAEYIVVRVGNYGLKVGTLNDVEVVELANSERYIEENERIIVVLSMGIRDELSEELFTGIKTPDEESATSIEVDGLDIELDYEFGSLVGQFLERGGLREGVVELESKNPFSTKIEFGKTTNVTFRFPGWTERENVQQGMVSRYLSGVGIGYTREVYGDSSGSLVIQDETYSKALWGLLGGGVGSQPLEDLRYRDESTSMKGFTEGILDAIFKVY